MNKPGTETAPDQDIVLSRTSYDDKELDNFNLDALQGMGEDEVEHVITLLSLRGKQLAYDRKILVEWYKDLEKATKESLDATLDHLKARRETDREAMRLVALGMAGPPDRTKDDAGNLVIPMRRPVSQ